MQLRVHSVHTHTPTVLGLITQDPPTHTPKQSHILKRNRVHVQYVYAYNIILYIVHV